MKNFRVIRILFFACFAVIAVFGLSACAERKAYRQQGTDLQLTKTASPATASRAGEVITYSYTVTNGIGYNPVFVSAMKISIQDSPLSTPIVCPTDTLLAGDSVTCTATYILTKTDVQNGYVTNFATVTASFTSNDTLTTCTSGTTTTVVSHTLTDTASFTVPITPPPASGGVEAPAAAEAAPAIVPAPALKLEKLAEPVVVYKKDGNLIAYTFKITNTGNVPVEGKPFKVVDSLNVVQLSCPLDITLDVGDETSCTAFYLAQFQFKDKNGVLLNCATVEGMYSGEVVESNQSCINVFYEPPAEPDKEEPAKPLNCDVEPPLPPECPQ